MKNLIFIGAGGYFLELYEYISKDIAGNVLLGIDIQGVLDDKVPTRELACSYLGNVSNYIIQPNDIFIIAIGNVSHRERIFSTLKGKGATFYTYKHPTALVSESAKVGEGCIICPFTIINAKAVIGENVSLNVNVSIGHEASVGPHSVLSPYVALNGNASVAQQSFIGSRSTVFPSVKVGAFCTIDTHTAVRKSCGDKMILSERTTVTAIKNRLMR